MKNKTILISVIIAVIILSASVLLWLMLIPDNAGGTPERDNFVQQRELLNAIPADAIGVLCFRDISSVQTLFESGSSPLAGFTGKGGVIKMFFKYIIKEMGQPAPAPVISLHYSAKNRLSLIFYLKCDSAGEQLVKKAASVWGLSPRKFGNRIIYKNDAISLALSGGFVIFSQSELLTESSLRHLESHTSILDNEEFSSVFESVRSYNNLAILNNSQAGKLFSGLTLSAYWKYADFFRNFCSWSAFDMEKIKAGIAMKGKFINFKGSGYYTRLFSGLEAEKQEATDILPYNTIAYFSFSVKDFSRYFSNYESFLSYSKEINDPDRGALAGKLITCGMEEIVSALVYTGERNEWVTLLRFGSREGAKRAEPYINTSKLFGRMFSDTTTYRVTGRWSVRGSEKTLNLVSDAVRSDSTLGFRLNKEGIKSYFQNDKALLTLYLCNPVFEKYLPVILNDRIKREIFGADNMNVNPAALLLRVFPGDNELQNELILFSQK